ncbi:WD40 repeat domain-containing protein [archaeon]|nr:MAG: WD40 repeat domain-containing protein [archaeon]
MQGHGGSSGARGDDPMHSPEMAHALCIMERLSNQNAEDEIYSDFKYWEDASDAFRDSLGTCLPLWRFEDARTKKKMVTAVVWNPGYPDMFAVGYGSYDFMKQSSGLVCVYSLKNVGHPEYTFSLDSGVMCLDFHPVHHALLAVGCYDGTVKVFDVRKRENKHIFASDIKSGKHSDPVWEVRWTPDDIATKELSFYSVSSDGTVANWVVTKSELKMEVVRCPRWQRCARIHACARTHAHARTRTLACMLCARVQVMTLKLASAEKSVPVNVNPDSDAPMSPKPVAPAMAAATASAAAGGADDEARLTGLAGGCCFAFNPFQESMYVCLDRAVVCARARTHAVW